LITFGQLFLAVSIPALISLVGIILNRSEVKEVATELKNFRIEMAKELGAINTRIAVIETKLGITKEVAA
jgi:hypothetical protein